MRRNIPQDERSPVRRGRPRKAQAVTVVLDGDMHHALKTLAERDGRPVGGMLRKILALGLETPDLWLES